MDALPPKRNFISESSWQALASQIHASGRQIVISATGGGSGAISALLQTPGASRSILEAVVPYSFAALVDWIGGRPDQACSEATARAMAMAAFMRARELAPDADPTSLLGVGATASLASDRPKRGERRVHVALQTATRTWAGFSSFDHLPAERAGDERVATELLISVIAGGSAIASPPPIEAGLTGQGVDATAAETELLLGRRQRLHIPTGAESSPAVIDEPSDVTIEAVFPGAFNPRHAGHLQMAAIAEHRLSVPVAWELSIANVDKPPLDFIAIRERIDPLRFDDPNRMVVLTRAPTFAEKAGLFPGATFVVGADTIQRIADLRYYGGDSAQRDAAIAEIANLGCRFLVFGRELNGKFTVLSALRLPANLQTLCDEVPADQFREDISSTALRSSH